MIKIPDIIQLNDWGIKKFLRAIIAIQLVMFGSIGLDFMGLEIPILRQVVGFIFLTFVPGIIILRLLKIHRLGIAVTVLLSAGLSISFLMFSGFILNLILLFLKIDYPLSFRHVYIFITTLLNILFLLSAKIDRFYQYESLAPLKISRPAFFLMLLPVLSIIGTYLVNFHKNNILLMILIALLALILVLVAFKKINPELYPLALWVIAISLLLHRSLISMNLSGYDINIEYYFHKLVVNNFFWNSNINSDVNSMLSIVILPAMYSYFLKMDGVWVFKIVYSIIFSLIPIGLYYFYKSQIKSDKIAFFSVFFFMSFITFFTEMISLARQQIAELFFVLLMILMVQNIVKKNIRNVLLLIFSASLVTSHYGLSYIFIFLIIIVYLFSLNLISFSRTKMLTLPEFNLTKLSLKYFMVFYIIFALFWYLYFSRSSVFNSIVNIIDHIFNSLFNEFFKQETRDTMLLQGLGIADPIVPSFGRQIHRALQFITQFFIITGFLKIIIFRESIKFKAEYFYLIFASMIFLLLSMLPNFAKSFNMSRIYHIMLFSLSPLFIIGGEFVIENIIRKMNIKNRIKQNYTIYILILGILLPYFLFNSGFVYEITNDSPNSVSLGMERMQNDNRTKVYFYSTYIPEQDVYSATWYYKNKYEKASLYADKHSTLGVLYSYGMTQSFKVNNNPFKGKKLDYIPHEYYVYLRKLNVCDNIFVVSTNINFKKSTISPLLNNSNMIYSNGCGEIYKK